MLMWFKPFKLNEVGKVNWNQRKVKKWMPEKIDKVILALHNLNQHNTLVIGTKKETSGALLYPVKERSGRWSRYRTSWKKGQFKKKSRRNQGKQTGYAAVIFPNISNRTSSMVWLYFKDMKAIIKPTRKQPTWILMKIFPARIWTMGYASQWSYWKTWIVLR